MALTETNIVNAFETTLAAQLASGGSTMNLTDDPGVAAPAYFVIAPDSDSAREVIKWDSGAYNNASVTRDLDSKHGTDPTHASGTTVRLAVVKQHIEDAHDRINDIALTGDVTGTLASATQDVATTIAADTIDGSNIVDDAIDSEHYVDGSIDTAHLAADAVDGTKIADDAIDSEHYVDGSIDTAHLAADAVTEAKIADDAVESEHLNDNVISGQTELASGLALTDELLVSDAGTVKRMDVSLIADAIAGTGLSASAGQLTVTVSGFELNSAKGIFALNG